MDTSGRFSLWLAEVVGYGLHRLLDATYRYRIEGLRCNDRRAAGEPIRGIYAAWHGDLWLCIRSLKRQGVCVMISEHRDGEIITRVLGRYGFTAVRGSSTRGGARAMLEFARHGREGDTDLCVTVDGPRGPAREVKEGILYAASRSGLPIVPMLGAVDRAWEMGSWDRLRIAKPGARVAVAFGEPVHVPAEASRDELTSVHLPRVTAAMERAEEAAKRAWTDGMIGSEVRPSGKQEGVSR